MEVVFLYFQIPQHSTKDQKLRLFNSGKVTMDVHINKMAFCQGKGPSVFTVKWFFNVQYLK